MENNDRFPMIPLDYSQRHRACKKEILFDYKTGKLYVVSAKDKTIIHDITQNILDVVSREVKADNLVVDIEGVGKVNLKKYISDLKNKGIHATTLSDKTAIGYTSYDLASICNRDGVIQLYNFWKAQPGQVPTIDENGILQWVNPDTMYFVKDVTPSSDGNITLSDRYNASTVSNRLVLTIQAVRDYTIISWKVTTTSSELVIEPGVNMNIRLEYDNDLHMNPNSVHIYTFETFDHGATWFESVKKYTTGNAKLDRDYLNTYYYNKTEVQELLKWKNKQLESIEY